MGEALDRSRDPDLGPGDLHRLREVRSRVPARRDPHEGLRPGRGRRRAGDVPAQGVEGPRAAGASHDDPGGTRRLHRVRDLRRRLPRAQQGTGQAQGDRHVPEARSPRRGACELGLLLLDRRSRPHDGARRDREGIPAAPAALRVLGRLRGLRGDPVPQAPHPARRRPLAGRERDGVLLDLRRQPAHDPVVGRGRRPGTGVVQLAVRGQRRVRTRHATRASTPSGCWRSSSWRRSRTTSESRACEGSSRGPSRATATRSPASACVSTSSVPACSTCTAPRLETSSRSPMR